MVRSLSDQSIGSTNASPTNSPVCASVPRRRSEEIAAAKREIRRLVLPLDLRRTRRLRADPLGPVTDLRRTIRQSLRQGGEILTIARKRQVTRPPPLAAPPKPSGLRVDFRARPLL